MIAHGASLTDILEDLCRAIDAQAPNIISSVLLMEPDGQRLRPAAGDRVPSGWAQAITPVTIGPCVGSCGTAAFLKKPVIVSDIASDPLWVDFRDIALSHGLRAAWSQPLLSKNDEVLGTFCLYYPEVRSPNRSDLRLLEDAGHVAVIAIEGERTQAALTKAFAAIKESEAQLREIVDAIPHSITVLGPDGDTLYVNRVALDYSGLTMNEVMAPDYRARVFHPDDIERLRDERQKALSRGRHLRMSNEQGGATGSIVGFLSATTRCGTRRDTLFAGMRQGRTSKTASKPKSESEAKISRCAKRSIALRCSRRS